SLYALRRQYRGAARASSASSRGRAGSSPTAVSARGRAPFQEGVPGGNVALPVAVVRHRRPHLEHAWTFSLCLCDVTAAVLCLEDVGPTQKLELASLNHRLLQASTPQRQDQDARQAE